MSQATRGAVRTAAVLAFAVSITCGLAKAQDPIGNVSAGKVEIENNRVRVLRTKLGPGEKVPLHHRPPSVVVHLTDSRLRISGADGRLKEVAKQAGEIEFLDEAEYAQENISQMPIEAVVVELKPRAPGIKPVAITLDPVKLDPEHHTVPFENDRVRVLRTVLEPHLQSPMHEHPAYVVVYLTDLHTKMTLADGKTVDNPRRPGEIAWREAYRHVTENVGDRTAVEIQVELK